MAINQKRAIQQISHLSSWPAPLLKYPGLAHGWPGYAWIWIRLFEAGLIDDPKEIVWKGVYARLKKDLSTFQEQQCVSLLIGFGSVPLLAALLSKHHPRAREVLREALQKWKFVCLRSYHKDVMLGHAGALLACAEIEDACPSQIPPELIRFLGKSCISRVKDLLQNYPNTPVTLGLSHGLAGFLLSIEMARTVYALRVDERLLSACRELIWQERMEASEGCAWAALSGETELINHSWCHGAPGIGLGMLCCYRLTGVKDYWRIAQHALDGTYLYGTGQQSFCCGACGRAQILIEAYRQTKDQTWLRKGRILMQRHPYIDMENRPYSTGFHEGRLGNYYLHLRSMYADSLPLPALGILSSTRSNSLQPS